MKKTFVCSLCHKGVLGGGLFVDNESVTYKTGKVTVEPMYRNLCLNRKEIKTITWKWVIFPVATFEMENGSLYSFIIYNKWGFIKAMDENINNQ